MDKDQIIRELLTELEKAKTRLETIAHLVNGGSTPERIRQAFMEAYSGELRDAIEKYTKEAFGKQRLLIHYLTWPTDSEREVEMDGVFDDMEHYERFEKEESKRSCYRLGGFQVEHTTPISEGDYQAYLQKLHTPDPTRR